eukprot:6193082-Pleurochrysis_carterae.AAC.2
MALSLPPPHPCTARGSCSGKARRMARVWTADHRRSKRVPAYDTRTHACWASAPVSQPVHAMQTQLLGQLFRSCGGNPDEQCARAQCSSHLLARAQQRCRALSAARLERGDGDGAHDHGGQRCAATRRVGDNCTGQRRSA